jgi:hypothetical protein
MVVFYYFCVSFPYIFLCKHTHTHTKKRAFVDNLDLVNNKSRRKRLSKLGSLCLILDNKSVKITRTSNLELGRISVLLDASGLSVLSTGNFEELLNILNLLRLYKCQLVYTFITKKKTEWIVEFNFLKKDGLCS